MCDEELPVFQRLSNKQGLCDASAGKVPVLPDNLSSVPRAQVVESYI